MFLHNFTCSPKIGTIRLGRGGGPGGARGGPGGGKGGGGGGLKSLLRTVSRRGHRWEVLS